MITETEENYLKLILHLSKTSEWVSTSDLSRELGTRPATVTDMVKRLGQKGLAEHIPYQGIKLNRKGEKLALNIIRRHRLWEVFLTEILKFGWDEVHEMAEELEHVSSDELINRLENYLGNPRFDPHGDPIPDIQGRLPVSSFIPMTEVSAGKDYLIKAMAHHEPSFLRYIEKIGLVPGTPFQVKSKEPFDRSLEIRTSKNKKMFVSHEVALCLLVTEVSE